jgi:phosphoesterase RecJ-like protein
MDNPSESQPATPSRWNDQEFEGIAEAILSHDKFVITTHVSPDGDAVGSAKAMESVLRSLGKEVWLYHSKEIPSAHKFLGNDTWHMDLPEDLHEWGVMIVDCGSFDRAGNPDLSTGAVVLNIDHHATNPGFGDFNCVRPEESSTCEMLLPLIDKLGITITPQIATSLYTGIWTDTGKLRYPNVTPNTDSVIKRLGEVLGGHDDVVAQIDYCPPSWAKYAQTALSKKRSIGEGGLTLTHLSLEDLREAGVEDDQAKEAGNIATDTVYWEMKDKTEMLALIYDLPTGLRSVSLRAYDPDKFHAGEIATSLGGGGHKAAAGFTTELSISEIGERVYEGYLAQGGHRVSPSMEAQATDHSFEI